MSIVCATTCLILKHLWITYRESAYSLSAETNFVSVESSEWATKGFSTSAPNFGPDYFGPDY